MYLSFHDFCQNDINIFIKTNTVVYERAYFSTCCVWTWQYFQCFSIIQVSVISNCFIEKILKIDNLVDKVKISLMKIIFFEKFQSKSPIFGGKQNFKIRQCWKFVYASVGEVCYSTDFHPHIYYKHIERAKQHFFLIRTGMGYDVWIEKVMF